MKKLTESMMDPTKAQFREVVRAGDPWMKTIRRGQIFRIHDIDGNQAADTLFFNAADPEERYSAVHTIRNQSGIYLTTGSELISTRGKKMLTITADTCGRHDTLGGACAAESNTVRYAHEKKHMHSCRDSFLRAVAEWPHHRLAKKNITANINFFMNVPVTPDGKLTFEDGISDAGKYVEMRAEMDVICLISDCPQLNNPCNAYNPTPVEVIIWDPA